MSVSSPSPQIIVKIVRRSDGNTMSMHITENENHTVKFIKSHVKNIFRSNKKFHLYYKNKHIRSRHKLSYYGITSQASNIEIIVA